MLTHRHEAARLDCGEFQRGLMSEKIGWLIAVKFYNSLVVIWAVDCGEWQ